MAGKNFNVKSPYKVPINNDMLDPMQGFDADLWALDQATGNYLMVGRFVSIQITVRNATEPYLEFNQRIPRMLDGEIQIGWVIERGQLDYRILEQTFGLKEISRQARLNRFPRLQITFSLNAAELQDNTMPEGYSGNFGGTKPGNYFNKRQSVGRLRLTFCKVDSFTLGATAGRSVIANRWEGMAEGIEQIAGTNAGAGTVFQNVDAATAFKNARKNDNAIDPFPWDLGSKASKVPTFNDKLGKKP